MVCTLLLQAGRERSDHFISHLLCCLLRHTDIPAPQLIGGGGHELGLLVGRMRQLIAALANLAVLVEQAIHGANRAVILAFIEQRRINSGWRTILETFFV